MTHIGERSRPDVFQKVFLSTDKHANRLENSPSEFLRGFLPALRVFFRGPAKSLAIRRPAASRESAREEVWRVEERNGTWPGTTKKERRNRRCWSLRLVDPTATIYHAAVASIVLLVLRYASRREKPKRATLSLSPPLSFSLSPVVFLSLPANGGTSSRLQTSVQHVFVPHPPPSCCSSRLCVSTSPDLPLLFSFLFVAL